MKFKLNGKKYKYKPEYYKREDDLNIKLPSYSIFRYGEIFHEGEWKDCRLYIIDRLGKSRIEVYPIGITTDSMSEIGKVNSQGSVDVVELSKFKRFRIKIYDFIFLRKIQCLSIFDRVKLIKKNLKYILIALLGSIIYFLINHFYDSFLQELINKSNSVQSLIVFLSLSSIMNIFHPFTLRKEWTIEEIDSLIQKRIKKERKDLEHEEWAKKKGSL
jgi:hypothetical protein